VISYSTNWMGPVSTRWYEERGIPFEMKKTTGNILPVVEYKEYLESYSCGRIDIRGLDEEENYNGWSEYGVAPMLTEDWILLSDWLDDLTTVGLWEYDILISIFESEVLNGRKIRWFNKEENNG